MAEFTIPVIGPERACRQYPFAALREAGATLAAGSDWPVTSPDPISGIHVAANRILPHSTAEPFLFYLLYLAILVIGGSYVLVRLGLTDLEAGYAVSQLHGHVGDRMRVTYTLRNASRIPKLWLEIHNPTTLPGGLPGRAITLAGRTERSWLIRAPLARRGHFRVEPLHIRTGDPFGFFEASATVGQGISIVVYPRIEPLPRWRLPAAPPIGRLGRAGIRA